MHIRRAHRPLIIGRQGAVASNHPLATQAGLEILKAGGCAADAAVAVATMLGVVEPHMSGLGGDGFYHTFDAASGRSRVYNGSGHAPAQARLPDTQALDIDGPASVSVPGAVAGLGMLHQQEGVLPWSTLLAPAIGTARNGFGVTHVYQRFAERNLARVRAHAASAATYLCNGEVPAPGHFIVQPKLAATLEQLAAEGADSFYRGPLARRLLDDMAAQGVRIDAADLASFYAEEQAAIAVAYRGFTVTQTPPNSTGFVLLEALRLVEQFDLRNASMSAADLTHLLIEAKKLAFVDRERYAGDPRFVDVPLARLLSDSYAREQAASIDFAQAASRPVRARKGDGNTTYFCVIDQHGNAVSAIQSLNNTFGSGVLLPHTGVLLNNRLNCWHLDATHPNNLQPQRRVRHTMNAPMVFRDGRLWAVFGTPGADDQVQVNLQMAVALMDFDQDPQSAVEAPRWSSSQPGQDANWPHGGSETLSVEADFDPAVVAALRARGHQVTLLPPREGTGSLACIRVLENGTLLAASDPRRDGWAAAW